MRRCLSGRHARAGRSPRASEVGALAENRPVDRASTRDTLGRIDGPAPFRADAARQRCHPSAMPGTDQWNCVELTDAGDDKSVVKMSVRRGRAVGGRSGRSPSMPRRHRRPEGASASDRYPKGRDRLRARSPQAIERGPQGNARTLLVSPYGSCCAPRAGADVGRVPLWVGRKSGARERPVTI